MGGLKLEVKFKLFNNKKWGYHMAGNIFSEDKWWIYDGGQNYGPLSWAEVVEKVNRKNISNKAFIKTETMLNWAPIAGYFHPGQLYDPEIRGMIPGKYDLIFLGGLGIFFMGFITLFFHPIGIIFCIISPIVESYAIYLEHNNRPIAVTSMLGNICAGAWIGGQIVLSIIIVLMILQI